MAVVARAEREWIGQNWTDPMQQAQSRAEGLAQVRVRGPVLVRLPTERARALVPVLVQGPELRLAAREPPLSRMLPVAA